MKTYIKKHPKTHTYLSLGKVVGWYSVWNTGQPLSTGVQATREGIKECTLSPTRTQKTHIHALKTARTDIHRDSLMCNFILLVKALTFPEEWGKGVCSGCEWAHFFTVQESQSFRWHTLNGCQTSPVFQDGTQLWIKWQCSLTLRANTSQWAWIRLEAWICLSAVHKQK